MRPKLKVCGVNDAGFAAEAARLGVDYIGLIFAAKSPRRVTLGDVKAIRAAAPGPKFVGVFTDTSVEVVARIVEAVPLDVVQLHGPYEDGDIELLRRLAPPTLEVWRLFGACAGAEDAVLLDGRDGARTGGTGKLADWSLVPELKRRGLKVVLAGGLGPDNVAAAARTGVDVIDVNSSLESSPGVKSTALLHMLINRLPTLLAE